MIFNSLKISFFVYFSAIILLLGCQPTAKDQADALIETHYGKIYIKLYDDTPEHKRNFLKLAREGFYDQTLFHRLIPDFVVQGGDPVSKDTAFQGQIGVGDIGYKLKPEIHEHHIHRKGVIAMASAGSNTGRSSDGAQFYIVLGHKCTDFELDSMEIDINGERLSVFLEDFNYRPENEAFKIYRDQIELNKFAQSTPDSFNRMQQIYRQKAVQTFLAEHGKFEFSPEQRKAYKEIGGSRGLPRLDGKYTIFGEVIDGFDVLDKLSDLKTGKFDRPLANICMKVTALK